MKKLLALFLAFCMIFSSVAALAEIDIALDTIEIYTAEDLRTVAESVYNSGFKGKTIVLKDDIDLENEEWTPIGTSAFPFVGTFDGNNHTISNLKITKGLSNTAENNNVGLFGVTNSPAVIKNFTIENVDITGSLYVGAVVGLGYTGNEVSNVTVKGDIAIDAWWYAGVIGGNGYMNKVSNCLVIGKEGSYIKGNDGSYIGGIWGFRGESSNAPLITENCSVSGLAISGVDRVGGISGIAHYGNTISGCSVSNTTVEATDPDATTVGIIAGACQGTESAPSVVEDNTVAEDVTASVAGTPVSGTVGTNINGSKPVVKTEAAKIGTTYYKTLADALAAAALVNGAVTIDLVSDATWETGAAHGSTPLIPADSAAIVTINGNGNTLTAIGAGVGPIRAANDTLLTFNNVNIVDRSESYAEGSWEFGYLEFAGKLKFTDCDFTGAIQIESENDNIANVEFTNCSFKSEKNSEYAVWLADGSSSFDNCSFTGARGLKMHEAYGSEVTSVKVEKCTFTGLSKKPAIAIGTVNTATSVSISDCEITDVQAGDQNAYLLESDTDVSAFNFVAENNKITVNDEVITPGVKIGDKLYPTFESALAVAVDGDVIDLSGNTHVLTNSNKNVKGKSITIENGKFDLGNTKWAGNSAFDIDNGGYLTLNNVDFVGNGYSSAYGVLYAHGKSTVELNNCDFDLKNEQYSAGGVLKGNGVADSTFIVNGGTFNLENPNRVIANATVAINGVTIDAKVTDNTLVVGTLNNHAFRNLVGRVINSTITADGFETGIKNTEGNLEITGNSVVTLKNSKVADLVLDNGKKVDVATTATLAYTTSDIASDATVSSNPVADTNGIQYFTLQDAVAAAKAGETITLYKDVTLNETLVINPLAQTLALRAVPAGITLDLNGKTISMETADDSITSLILNKGNLTITDSSADKTGKLSYKYTGTNSSDAFNTIESAPGSILTIKGGTIENLSANCLIAYAIDGLTNGNSGDVTVNIEGGTITSKKIAVRIFANSTTNTGALNISGGEISGRVIVQNPNSNANKATLNITGGNFKTNGYKPDVLYVGGTQGATMDITASVSGGQFNGEILDSTSKLDISGGTFSVDPADFVVAGKKAIADTYGVYKIVDAATVDSKIAVKFVKADVDAADDDNAEGEDLYNIVVANENGINKFNSADLTFAFPYTPATGSEMAYEILEKEGSKISVTPHPTDADRYMFNFDTKSGVVDTDTKIIIGQLKITGYGSYDFEIVGNTNEVHATTKADSVVDTYDTTGAAGKGELDITAKLDDKEIKVPTRELTIQIAFPNALALDNAIAYQDMKVEISGNFEGVQATRTYDLGSDGLYILKNGGYVVTEDDLVLNNTYNVTVTGAGYRTARYTVTMTEDKTLNFWNNVKDNDTAIEVGKETGKVTVTFLAGDIVKDNNINIYDLSAVVSYFGTTNDTGAVSSYAKYDLNRDGKIDSKDVAYVLVSWGN